MGGTTAAGGTVRASSGSPAAPPCRGSGLGDGASRDCRLHRLGGDLAHLAPVKVPALVTAVTCPGPLPLYGLAATRARTDRLGVDFGHACTVRYAGRSCQEILTMKSESPSDFAVSSGRRQCR